MVIKLTVTVLEEEKYPDSHPEGNEGGDVSNSIDCGGRLYSGIRIGG